MFIFAFDFSTNEIINYS